MTQRHRTLTGFVLGLGTGLAAYAAVSTGVVAGGASSVVSGVAGAVGSVLVPPAAARELPAFEDCEQLRQWYVRTALAKVGPWGLDGSPVAIPMPAERSFESSSGTMEGDAASGVPAPDQAVGSSGTGTNVQEAGVDESDVAKTDGRLVVRISGSDLVVTDVSGPDPVELSRTALSGPSLSQPELVLHDGHVVVVGSATTRTYGGPIFDREDVDPRRYDPGFAPQPVQDARTLVVGYDLTDPSAPRLTTERSLDGEGLSTRLYPDGTVRVVLTTDHPPLDFVQPHRDRSAAEATRLNKQVVRDAPLRAWLPRTRTRSGTSESLLGCSDVRHPVRPSGFGTISVVAFPAATPSALDASAVVASGDLVYSSSRRLYVATTTPQGTTTLHAFALDGERTSYVASGEAPGTVKDRWSLSEQDGRLRVATALGDSWNPRENAVVVLAERGGRLEETGRVDGLGRDEQIKSVRWLGDLAVLVTFRQTDPLYTVDLSDPDHPRLVATLEMPGFSSYLHPVGDDLLVGLGHDATSSGVDLGTQAATYDLHDLADVRRVDRLSLGGNGEVGATTDPRTVTYLPARRTLLTTVDDWDTGTAAFEALHVGRDGSLRSVGSWRADRSGLGLRALPLDGDRVALVGDEIRVVDVG